MFHAKNGTIACSACMALLPAFLRDIYEWHSVSASGGISFSRLSIGSIRLRISYHLVIVAFDTKFKQVHDANELEVHRISVVVRV